MPGLITQSMLYNKNIFIYQYIATRKLIQIKTNKKQQDKKAPHNKTKKPYKK